MGGSARSAVPVWLVLTLFLALLGQGEARTGRNKLAKGSRIRGVRKEERGKVYGDRRPWEDRQDTYDWEFMGADFYTKIRTTWDNNYVGSDEEALAKPLCGALNATKETTYYGKWHSDDKGHYWWEPQNCRLRRLSGAEARQCLNNRHLFFAGDSLTRYQYLSFVSFLSKGKYMVPYAHGDVRSLAVEREWDGWDDFFKSGSLLLASEANEAVAHESCDCVHGAYGGFSDVPSHEIRDFTLRDFPLLEKEADAKAKSPNLIRVSNTLVYNNPSHIQAGIETLLFALKKLPQLTSKPDAVVINMGIWVRDWAASGEEYQHRFETILQHGNYFQQNASQPASRLLWKTTTNTVGDVVEEESWNAVNEGSLRAVETTPPWQLYDIRAISRQALEQHLNFYSFDAIHFAPLMYQEFNDFLFNILCDEHLNFQTENLSPPDPKVEATKSRKTGGR